MVDSKYELQKNLFDEQLTGQNIASSTACCLPGVCKNIIKVNRLNTSNRQEIESVKNAE